MSIQEFAQQLERGEVATELAKLRDLPEPSALQAESDGWPQWYGHKKEI